MADPFEPSPPTPEPSPQAASLPRSRQLPRLISAPPVQKPASQMGILQAGSAFRPGFWSSITDLHWIAFLVSALILAGLTVSLAVTFRAPTFHPAPRLLAASDDASPRDAPEILVRVETPVASEPAAEKSDSSPAEPQAPGESKPATKVAQKEPSDVDRRPLLDLSSRTHRTPNLRDHGGSTESERAVERGLRWLVAHQANDGSWRFDLSGGICNGYCRNRGSEATTTGATGLALLAFLGAGYTNREGEYQLQIDRALYYLRSRARPTPRGVDMTEGVKRGMYGHGIAAIALCEAYALTQDLSLKDLAQRSIDFIVDAQHAEGGGWRYEPHAPGDTTVTGWQIMALKCAEMARLNVPSPTFVNAQHFLDTVQSDEGAQYAYMVTEPKRSQATTAIGLLTRMYLGWQVNDRRLTRGVALLSKWGAVAG